jgi:DNA mismatch repair protein MutS2
VVESVHDGNFTVVVGPLRFRARQEELEVVSRAAAAPRGSPAPARISPGISIDEEPAREINIIGLTADEAVERVDKFIDAAYLAGVDTVRIIHGHGKGVLRRAVAELLTGHSQVQSFAPAPPNQGGGGATVAQLRND